MTEEQKDWEDFIAWLDSEDAYKICFDSDTAHAIKLVARELKERREDEEWLKRSAGLVRLSYMGACVMEHDGHHKPIEIPWSPTLHAAVLAARGGK